jgi:hypothetical protein
MYFCLRRNINPGSFSVDNTLEAGHNHGLIVHFYVILLRDVIDVNVLLLIAGYYCRHNYSRQQANPFESDVFHKNKK